LQTQDELAVLKTEISRLKQEAQTKEEFYKSKITDFENQLNQARALIGIGFIACYLLYLKYK
jgi:hypothetical protein